MIIPTPEQDLLSSRGQIDKPAMEFLDPGTTTMEQVLLRFGEPDATLNDQRIFVYHWQVARAYFVIFVPDGAGGPIGKDYLMLLSFDESSRLERFGRVTPGLFETIDKRVRRWIDGEDGDVAAPPD